MESASFCFGPSPPPWTLAMEDLDSKIFRPIHSPAPLSRIDHSGLEWFHSLNWHLFDLSPQFPAQAFFFVFLVRRQTPTL